MIFQTPKLKNLEPDVNYKVFYFEPASGKRHDVGQAKPDSTGTWEPLILPTFEDWVIVLEKV